MLTSSVVLTEDSLIKICNICLAHHLTLGWAWHHVCLCIVKVTELISNTILEISGLMLNLCKVTKKTRLGGNKRKWKINCMDVIKGLEEEFKNQLLSIYSFFNSLLNIACFPTRDSYQCHRNTWWDQCSHIFLFHPLFLRCDRHE